MIKVGSLGAGILAFGALTAGVAIQTTVSASSGPSAAAQPAVSAVTPDDSQVTPTSPPNTNPVNPAPGIVSGQS
jgi:hypothetical protein